MNTMPKEAQEHLAEVAVVLRDILRVDPGPTMARIRETYGDMPEQRLSLLLHEHPYQLAVELGGEEAEAADTEKAFESYRALRAGEGWATRLEQARLEFLNPTGQQITPGYQVVCYDSAVLIPKKGTFVWSQKMGRVSRTYDIYKTIFGNVKIINFENEKHKEPETK